jgi:thiol:disulfide interchange protein DsbA
MARFFRQLTLLLLVCFGPAVSGDEPVAGRDYTELTPPQAAAAGKQIEVIEFFSYQCPHCDHFHGAFDAWAVKLPVDVAWRREPVVFSRVAWEASARMFHALTAMGKIDRLNGAIFDAIHRQGIALESAAAVTSWLAANHGIDADEFKTAYSDARDRLVQGQELAQRFRIPSVPSIVIAERYLVAISGGPDYSAQLRVVDALIARARAAAATKR